MRRWESITGNLALTTELKRKLATVKSKEADVSSVNPFVSSKTLKQKFIFQIGTLNPHGINERFSFNTLSFHSPPLPCSGCHHASLFEKCL